MFWFCLDLSHTFFLLSWYTVYSRPQWSLNILMAFKLFNDFICSIPNFLLLDIKKSIDNTERKIQYYHVWITEAFPNLTKSKTRHDVSTLWALSRSVINSLIRFSKYKVCHFIIFQLLIDSLCVYSLRFMDTQYTTLICYGYL